MTHRLRLLKLIDPFTSLVVCVCLLLLGLSRAEGQQPASTARSGSPESGELRVGIVATDDFESELQRWAGLFRELELDHPQLNVRLALGTYGDLSHWMREQLIDIAVLTPGVFAEHCAASDGAASTCYRYVATAGLPPATTPWAAADRQRPGFDYVYQAVCLVANAAPIHSAEDLRRLHARGRLQFIFVHPLSVSGRIVPEVALRQLGIEPKRAEILYSYSHSASLRLLAEHSDDAHRVAFVWDDAGRGMAETAAVRPVPLQPLQSIAIPHDLIAVRPGLAQADLIRDWFLEHEDQPGDHDFQQLDQWQARYGAVQRWSRQLGLSAASADVDTISLEELGQVLLQSARSQPTPPRLALVLPGGGAKCSYQVGAVNALEEHLTQLRQAHPQIPLDIDLIVGTSGGAINALPIALGISSTPAGREDMEQVWQRLDQRQIVRPSTIVRWNMGLWFALVQIAVVIFLVRWLFHEPYRRAWISLLLLATIAAGQIIAGYVDWSPWRLLGENHFWHHAWLWLTFGLRFSAWTLVVLSMAGLAGQIWLRRRGQVLQLPTRPLIWALAVLLTGLPLIQVLTVLFFQRTLSGGEGMEAALATHYPALINRHLTRHQQAPLDLEGTAEDADRLRATSQQIMERGLLERDLVMTGNCLAQSTPQLPSDLYFYARAGNDTPAPPFGPRGIALEEYPSLVLDVVLGSGSIFPVFPPRHIQDFPKAKEHVELIDGGFAHNRPIEAAVLWQATHVVLIEATPEKQRLRRNFAENAAAAFAHLHKQTQLVDARSSKQVVVFTLAPEPPHLCVLDFADNLVADSIRRGYDDARGRLVLPDGSVVHQLRFRKAMGEPILMDVERLAAAEGG